MRQTQEMCTRGKSLISNAGLSVFYPPDRLLIYWPPLLKRLDCVFLATVYVCNTNRLTWWALLSTWRPLRREGHLFMPACTEGSPDLCVIHPLHSDICPISSQLLHPPHPPALLSPPSRSAGPFTPGAVPRDAGHERGQLADLPEVIVWEKRLEMFGQTELSSQVTHLLHVGVHCIDLHGT